MKILAVDDDLRPRDVRLYRSDVVPIGERREREVQGPRHRERPGPCPGDREVGLRAGEERQVDVSGVEARAILLRRLLVDHGAVERAPRDASAFAFINEGGYPLGQLNAATLDADKDQFIRSRKKLDHLIGHASQSAGHGPGVEHNGRLS